MKKEKLFVRAADMFDVPADAKGGLLHIELEGTREVFLENHKGIISLADEEIEINSPSGVVSITGQKLFVKALNADEISLCGKIEKIEFKGGES